MRTREALARLQGCRRQLDSQSGLAGRQGAERNQIGDQLHHLKAVELAVKDVETIYGAFVANLQTAYGANFTRDCDGLSMRDRELLASLLLPPVSWARARARARALGHHGIPRGRRPQGARVRSRKSLKAALPRRQGRVR